MRAVAAVAPALAAVGRFTRARGGFPLILAAASWGVLREAIRPVSWRRTVRHEFKLGQAMKPGINPATRRTAQDTLARLQKASSR